MTVQRRSGISFSLLSLSLFLSFSLCLEITTKCRRKDGSGPYSFKYLNPKTLMRFACKSFGGLRQRSRHRISLGAKSDFSPDSIFQGERRHSRRLFCDDRYVSNVRNMWPLEVSLFLLHHRHFMIRLRLLQLLQYIYRYFRIDNSMPFFFAIAPRNHFPA